MITFLSPQPREILLNELYPNHDVFTLLYESFGVVLLEAMSFGLGLIATDLYATPEMVHNGQNGVLFPHPFLKPTSFNSVPTIDCVIRHYKIQFHKLVLRQ